MEKIRDILFTIDGLGRGGKERQLCILTKGLLDRGINVQILTLSWYELNYLSEYGIELDRIHLVKNRGYRKTFQAFRKKLKDIKPQIVFSWDTQSSFYNLLLYRELGFRFINGSIQHGIRLLNVAQIVRSIICWLSPHIVANSFAGLKANNLKPGRKCNILYNGIESKFSSNYTTAEKLKKRTQLIPNYIDDSDTLVFISIANLVPYKDYNSVIESLKSISTSYSFHYLIIGEGPMRFTIEKKIEEYQLTKQIHLIGQVQNVEDYLAISDILIHSSRGEGVSNAILEAMYSGLPIIASKTGGTPEIVYGLSSKLFNYKNIKELAILMKQAKSNFKDFDSKEIGYQNHLKRFSTNAMVERFIQILTKIIATSSS